MSLILDGSNGLSDVDGSAATPAIRGTDANTGMFFPATDTIAFSEGGVESMRITAAGDVGIGTASPAGKFGVSDGTVQLIVSPFSLGSAGLIGTSTNHSLNFLSNNIERMRIDSSGRITMPSQPGFMAGIASASDATISANSLIPFNSVTGNNTFNTGGHFATGTSLFTAPIAGRYFFSFTLYLTNSGGNTQNMQPGIRVNGSFIAITSGDTYAVSNAIPNSTGGVISTTTSVILNLAANDSVGVAARINSIRLYQGHSFFTGYLLG
jgi:hypothetical protein